MGRRKDRHREPSARPPDEEDKLSWRSAGGDVWERALDESDLGRDVDPDKSFFDAEDVTRAVDRMTTAMLRAGGVGCVLKGGLNLFSWLAGRRKSRRRGQPGPSVRDALHDTAAFASFLVAFAGTYVSVDECLALRYGKQQSKQWRAAVAGAVAGPALLLADGPHVKGGGGKRHYGLATYLWLRSTVLIARCGLKRRELPDTHPLAKAALAPFAHEHADVALMVASTWVILSCFVLKPDALTGAYGSFLNKHGGKTKAHYAALRAMALASTAAETRRAIHTAANALFQPGSTAHEALVHVANMDDGSLIKAKPSLWGLVLYPGSNAFTHFLTFYRGALGRALPIYVPLYAVPALIVHRHNLLGPRGGVLAMRAVLGAGRSSAFLAAYCACAWAAPDALQRLVFGTLSAWTVSASVPLAGLAVLIEKPSRRQELGVYCASRALEAAAVCSVSWGWTPRSLATRTRADVALFAAGAAAIMHCYNTERDVFRSKYLNVLDFVFGNAGHGRQRIRHVGSYYQVAFAAREKYHRTQSSAE